MNKLNYFHPAVRREVQQEGILESLCSDQEVVYSENGLVIWNNFLEIEGDLTRHLYALDIDNLPVGGAFVRELGDNWYHISGLYLDEDFRRIGVGSLLIQKYLEDVRKREIDTTLETQADEMEAIRFYEKNGFELFTPGQISLYALARTKRPLTIFGENIVVWDGDCDPEKRTNVVFGKRANEDRPYVFNSLNFS